MKKCYRLFVMMTLIAAVMLMGGCTVRSIDYVVEDADRECAQGRIGEIGKEILEKDASKKILVAVVAENVDERDEELTRFNKYVFDNLDAEISKIGLFEVIPRAELKAINNERKLQRVLGREYPDLPDRSPRLLIIYNIIYYDFEIRKEQSIDPMGVIKFTGELLGGGQAKRKSTTDTSSAVEKVITVREQLRGFAKVKISIYNTRTRKRESALTLSGYSNYSETKTGNSAMINEALENIVRDYMAQFTMDYAPAAAVLMTKGGGRIAMLNIGREHGVQIGTKVEFIEYLEEKRKAHIVPFAEGKVFEVDNDSCWVEVEDYGDVRVRKYSVARVKTVQKDTSNSH